MDDDFSHPELADIWRRAKQGEPFHDQDEAVLAAAMQDHPEYHPIWERADAPLASDRMVDGVNPFMHVAMHAIVENQVLNGNPPEVIFALAALKKRGTTHHEAVHAVADALLDEMIQSFQARKPLDHAGYQRRLLKIIA